jgi:hypothetical protein
LVSNDEDEIIAIAPRLDWLRIKQLVLIALHVSAPRVLGLDAMTDQQIAGLAMWMLGGTIYLIVLSAVFFA